MYKNVMFGRLTGCHRGGKQLYRPVVPAIAHPLHLYKVISGVSDLQALMFYHDVAVNRPSDARRMKQPSDTLGLVAVCHPAGGKGGILASYSRRRRSKNVTPTDRYYNVTVLLLDLILAKDR
ncbi:hypothetical protein RRG08_060617 [Elysia crispata]|uniref:Uncharacterized protein n=1 Tax=Elysia crispata TaxID=231223 RepID=A0AAE0Z330_9GAST|nr:hypothetical protein RRG08_060617 [Elysia crispata]